MKEQKRMSPERLSYYRKRAERERARKPSAETMRVIDRISERWHDVLERLARR